MLKFRTLFALPLIPLLAAAGLAAKPDKAAAGDIECRLENTRERGSVRLQAIAYAKEAVAGQYSFEVDKSGSAGMSQTAQSGEFHLSAGQETVLGEVTLGSGDGMSYTAVLTLGANGRQVSCSDTYPNRL